MLPVLSDPPWSPSRSVSFAAASLAPADFIPARDTGKSQLVTAVECHSWSFTRVSVDSWLTWCPGNFSATLEGALSKALCHPRQHVSAVSDLRTDPGGARPCHTVSVFTDQGNNRGLPEHPWLQFFSPDPWSHSRSWANFAPWTQEKNNLRRHARL